MIAQATLVVFATLGLAQVAFSQGSQPQSGACFATQTARHCVPLRYSLFEILQERSEVYASFEDNFLTMVVRTFPNEGGRVPQTTQDAFPNSMISAEFRRGIPLSNWGLTTCGAQSTFEAISETDETREYFVEIFGPGEVMYISLTEFSSETTDDSSNDFLKAISEIRFHLDVGCALGSIADLKPTPVEFRRLDN